MNRATTPTTAALFLTLALLLFYGCATPGLETVISEIGAEPSKGIYISNVPHYFQNRYMCGPAALASVINFYSGDGEEVALKDVEEAVFMKRIRTTLMMDMLIYAKKKGYGTNYFKGDIERLKSELKNARPVILLVDLGIADFPIGHYIVVVGYSEKEKVFIAHSGRSTTRAFTFRRLKSAWRKAGYQALVIYREGAPK